MSWPDDFYVGTMVDRDPKPLTAERFGEILSEALDAAMPQAIDDYYAAFDGWEPQGLAKFVMTNVDDEDT
jgi:hypothetical protein